MSALQPGTLVADKFRILRKIGSGGMATIFEAQDKDSAAKVALKIPHDSFRQDRGAMKRFLREARAAMAIDSPNVIRTLSVGKMANGMPFLAMEYVDGVALRDLMYDTQADPQPVAMETTLPIVDQIASALVAAHAVNVIHRDIKPDNVLIAFGQDGMNAKVFDFGLSLLSAEFSISRLTAPGVTFGTPQYMPPEQARNAGAADERADIYALGVIAYEMLAAKFPFEGETPLEVWRNATHGKPVDLTVHRPDVPAELAQLIMKAISRDPADRPQTAKAFREAIAPFLPRRGQVAGRPHLPAAPDPPHAPPPAAQERPSAPVAAPERQSAPSAQIQAAYALKRSTTLPMAVAIALFSLLVSAVVIAVLVLASR